MWYNISNPKRDVWNSMKHYLFAILCGAAILAGTQSYAQSEKLAISDKAVTVITTASDSGALPGSKLYFLKDWRRSLKLFFVKDPVKRADIRLSNAFERVQDIQELLKVDVSDASKNSIGEILNQNDQDILYAKQVVQYAYRQKALINEGKRFGVIKTNEENRITGFHEKPSEPIPSPNNPEAVLVSMGVYLFNTTTLVKAVIDDAKQNTHHDFGKNIIPKMIHSKRIYAYPFGDENNYWRDIGTLDAYWEANMDLVQTSPKFNIYDKDWPIRTYQGQYPPAKTVFHKNLQEGRTDMILNSIVSGGCIINGAKVDGCILSPDVRVDSNSEIYGSIIMESVRIGKNVKIRKAIIDKYVTIPDNFNIGYDPEEDTKHFTITDSGIVVVRKGMHLI